MKKRFCVSSFILAVIAAMLFPSAALAEDSVLGESVDGWQVQLAGGAALSECVFWTGKDTRTEHVITLPAGAEARIGVSSGALLCDTESICDAADAAARGGMKLIAAVNGDYYNMSTGVPVGIVVENGVLRSGCDGGWAFGVRADGTTVFSKPALFFRIDNGTIGYAVTTVNKLLKEGIILYTDDFSGKVNRGCPSVNLVCGTEDVLKTSGPLTLTAESCFKADGAFSVPEGKLVLSYPADGNEAVRAFLEEAEAGSVFTFSVRCAEGWEDVQSAVGTLYKLVTDGVAEEDLETAAAPRTAVGATADGTVILYTIDGRQSGYSIGCGMDAVAARMLELGCTEAGLLDGGGSTALGAILPGEEDASVIGSPSGGTERKVSDHLTLAVTGENAGEGLRLALYPLRIRALGGAAVSLTVKASDAAGNPAEVPETLSFSVTPDIGEIRDGVLYTKGNGSGTVTVSAAGYESAEIPVFVTASPDTLQLFGVKSGKAVTALTLEPSQTVDLTVKALQDHVVLSGDNSCVSWALDAAAGTVDRSGRLTAAADDGTGLLSVTAGSTVLQIPVTVETPLPFTDIKKADASYEAVKYVWKHGIFAGVSETEFDPDGTMTRAMLVSVFWRLSGRPDTSAVSSFTDVPADTWYTKAVNWAAEQHLVYGYSETEFAPETPITREQLTALLHRYVKWCGTAEAPAAEPVRFTDADSISDWALNDIRWAEGAGILPDAPDGLLRPAESAARAWTAQLTAAVLSQSE